MLDNRLEDRVPSIYIDKRRASNAPGSVTMAKIDKDTRKNLDAYQASTSNDYDVTGPESTRLHQTLLAHYIHELDRQSDNRVQMAIDEDIYDHDHWSDEDKAVLSERGQVPLVFNLTQTTINWVLGSQRRATMDYKILPRKKDGSKAAELKTQLFKHVSDVNRSEFAWNDAFASAVKAGIGWIEIGQDDPENGSLIYERAETWRNMLWDSTAVEYDLRDARYIGRSKWMDLDTAQSLWGNRAATLKIAANSSGTGRLALDYLGDEAMDYQEQDYQGSISSRAQSSNTIWGAPFRPRLRMVEMWFKRLVHDAAVMSKGQFNGELFDEWSEGHWADLESKAASIVIRPKEVIHCAILCEAGMIRLHKSPYRHNRYPFTPVWGYRRSRDGLPYGMIRGIRDINKDLNKRASKSLHLLSAKTIVAPIGSLPNLDVARSEAARPDAIIEFDPAKGGVPSITTDVGLAAAHLDMMGQDAQLIQSVGGVTDENMGRQTNAKSGKAIIARQEQGALATSLFFDNLRQSRLIHGEKQMVNIEQYYTEQDTFRVTGRNTRPNFVSINDGTEQTSIARFKADFVISEQNWNATARQAQSEQLTDLLSQLAPVAPDLVLKCLDLLIISMDIPYGDEIATRVRELNGQTDPNEDPDNPSEATQRLREQADMNAQIEQARLKLLADAEMAKIRKTNAEADRIVSTITNDQLAQVETAVRAAMAIATTPAMAAAADALLASARAAAMGQAPGAMSLAEPQLSGQPVTVQQPMPTSAQLPTTGV